MLKVFQFFISILHYSRMLISIFKYSIFICITKLNKILSSSIPKSPLIFHLKFVSPPITNQLYFSVLNSGLYLYDIIHSFKSLIFISTIVCLLVRDLLTGFERIKIENLCATFDN
ncbi:hypothetical protein Hanom_Chr04g00313631 [Helianthus anomalus]